MSVVITPSGSPVVLLGANTLEVAVQASPACSDRTAGLPVGPLVPNAPDVGG